MIRDLRYAIRALTRSPLFALSAVATLAVAIAVNTIIFTVLNSLALRPMPVRDADRFVRIYPVHAVIARTCFRTSIISNTRPLPLWMVPRPTSLQP